jgi:hypothetical protein
MTERWEPSFSPWRHGGWYVDNVRYPTGGCGCVSRNYPDRKWRIVCPDGTIAWRCARWRGHSGKCSEDIHTSREEKAA